MGAAAQSKKSRRKEEKYVKQKLWNPDLMLTSSSFLQRGKKFLQTIFETKMFAIFGNACFRRKGGEGNRNPFFVGTKIFDISRPPVVVTAAA